MEKDWRSVLDPATGRTYWYHRKTRETTWKKPIFEEQITIVDDQIKKELAKPPPVKVVTKVGVIVDGDVVRWYPSTEIQDNKRHLEQLFALCQDPSFRTKLQISSMLLSDFFLFLEVSENSFLKSLVIKILHRISIDRTTASVLFQQNQCWTSLPKLMSSWMNSELLTYLLAFICNLTFESTSACITIDIEKQIATTADKFLTAAFEPNRTFARVAATAKVLKEEAAASWYLEQCRKGHILATKFILLLAAHASSEEEYCKLFVSAGLLGGLQMIASGHQFDMVSRNQARALLEKMMSKSDVARRSVLDAFLVLSESADSSARPMGSLSSLLALASSSHDDQDQQQHTDKIDALYHIPSALGHEEGETNDELVKDVEWRPRSGIAWQLNSQLLWMRCPALRDLLHDFWQQGGGGLHGGVLELSIDASAAVVESICYYLHRGFLKIAPVLELQLEALRVASELGMQLMHFALEDHIVSSQLTLDTFDLIFDYAQSFAFDRLKAACVEFMNSGADLDRLGGPLLYSGNTKSAASTKLFDDQDQAQEASEDDFDRDLYGLAGGTSSALATASAALIAGHGYDSGSIALSQHESTTESAAGDWGFPSAVSSASNTLKSTHKSNTGKQPKKGGIYALLLGDGPESSNNRNGFDVTEDRRDILGSSRTASSHKSSTLNKSGNNSKKAALTSSKNSVGLEEYSLDMSLVPPATTTKSDKRSESEKRWEDLAKPRSQREKEKEVEEQRKRAANALNNSIDSFSKMTDDSAEHLPMSKSSEKKVSSSREATSSSSRPSSGSSQRQSTSKSNKQSFKSDLDPKQSASEPIINAANIAPRTSFTALDPRRNTAAEAEEAVASESTAVRSSLALLKAKVSSRSRGRRRLDTANTDEDEAGPPVTAAVDEQSPRYQPQQQSVATAPPSSSSSLRSNRPQQYDEDDASVGNVNQQNYDDGAKYLYGRPVSKPVVSSRPPTTTIPPPPKAVTPANTRAFSYHHDDDEREENPEQEEEHEEDGYNAGKSSFSLYAIEGTEDAQAAVGELIQCPTCPRSFGPGPFAIHAKICKKVFNTTRKPFDSAKQRLEELAAADELKKLDSKTKSFKGNATASAAATAAADKASKAAIWKEQSKQFRAAMKAAREYSNQSEGKTDGVVIASKPAEPYIDPTLVQCPSCERRFSAKAAERHIPVCKSIINKPSSLKKGGGVNASSGATQPPNNGNGSSRRGWQ